MESPIHTSSESGYRFDNFDSLQEAVINLVRWPEGGPNGTHWKIRCEKIEAGHDAKHGRFVSVVGAGGGTRYYIYENLSLDRQDPSRQIYSWEHFRDASVLLELFLTESAAIFGGSMKLIMKWLSDHAESIIEDTKFKS